MSGIPLQFIFSGFIWHARLTSIIIFIALEIQKYMFDITHMFHVELMLTGQNRLKVNMQCELPNVKYFGKKMYIKQENGGGTL